MTPFQHPSCNVIFGRPSGMTPDQCDDLHVLQTEIDGLHCLVSYWQPDEVELEALRNGGSVALHVYGRSHPVVALGVAPAT